MLEESFAEVLYGAGGEGAGEDEADEDYRDTVSTGNALTSAGEDAAGPRHG